MSFRHRGFGCRPQGSKISGLGKAVALVAAFLTTPTFLHAQAGAPDEASLERVVTFEDLDGVRDHNDTLFATIDLSGDGRYLAVARGQVLEVLDADTGRTLHALGEGSRPRWSPIGGQLAFYSIRSGEMQLWLWTAVDGQVRQLTRFPEGVDPDPTTRISGFAIDAFDYSWSPDGTRLVFASRVSFPLAGQPAGGPLILDRTTAPELTLAGIFAHPSSLTGGIAESPDGKQWRYRMQRPGERLLNRLFVMDIQSNATTMLDTGRGNLFHPQWSPDGGRIAFASVEEGAEILTSTSGEIRVHELAGGAEIVISTSDGMKYQPRWSNDGTRIAYLFGGIKPDIAVASLDGSKHGTHSFGRHVWNYRWASEGDALLLSYPEGAAARLGRLDLQDWTLAPLLDADIWSLWSQARDGSLAWMEGASGPDVWVRSAEKSAAVRLTNLASEESSAQFRLGQTETVSYRTPNGDALQGVLLYPPDYDPARKYPMIVDVYPLSRGDRWMHPMSGNQAWAAAGYLVFKPYARAPHVWVNCSGEVEFCRASRGPKAWDVAVDDVVAGIDEVISRGLADPRRICAYGFSNGGGAASHLVTRTDRFACAVIVAPALPSWIGAPLLAATSWQLLADWAGVDVLTDPAAHVALSATFRARHVRTPVLLAAGDQDGMFLLGAIEMYNALRFADKEVTLLRYPDQGHVFTGEGLRDLWERQMSFFDHYLNPDQE
ncbi:prolyl oligopeptidase family serine peptidase [Luteimonas saliphila]|uniref:prolyl oligopeptidase family serine peptidase n=1 Tax=Luteimonas saliphila TaxID=2804919 RepID=UPI00192DA908|nr:prolyl oligopeptidase family serine peptidase [Luteimonas saliphila]